MAPIVEVVFAPSTPEYRQDPSLIKNMFEIVTNAEGCLGAYHGYEVEDQSTLMIVAIWETLAHRLALVNNTPLYNTLLSHFAAVGDPAQFSIFHVPHFAPFDRLAAVLGAPYTSYAHTTTLKPGKTVEGLQKVLQAVVDTPVDEGGVGGLFGKAMENDGHIVLFGWDDPEYHAAFSEKIVGLLKQAVETAEPPKGGHVRFNCYKKYEA